jgi:hypothetical protein
MNPAHLHLLVNHLPIFGFALALPVLLLCWFRERNAGIALAGALLLIAGAGGAGAAVLTGEQAEEQLEDNLKSAESYVEAHEEAAKWAWPIAGIALLAGGVLFVGAWKSTDGSVGVAPLAVATISCLLAAATMARIGAEGGKIRHWEAREEYRLGWTDGPDGVSAASPASGDVEGESDDSGRGRGRGRGGDSE